MELEDYINSTPSAEECISTCFESKCLCDHCLEHFDNTGFTRCCDCEGHCMSQEELTKAIELFPEYYDFGF